jgi:hypothetical protein
VSEPSVLARAPTEKLLPQVLPDSLQPAQNNVTSCHIILSCAEPRINSSIPSRTIAQSVPCPSSLFQIENASPPDRFFISSKPGPNRPQFPTQQLAHTHTYLYSHGFLTTQNSRSKGQQPPGLEPKITTILLNFSLWRLTSGGVYGMQHGIQMSGKEKETIIQMLLLFLARGTYADFVFTYRIRINWWS